MLAGLSSGSQLLEAQSADATSPGGDAELQHHLFDRDRVGHPGRCRPRRRRSGGVSSVSDDHVAACAAARTGRRQRRQHARWKRALPQPEHDLRGQAHAQRSRRRSRDADADRCHPAAADALRRRQSVPCDAGIGRRRRIADRSVQGHRRGASVGASQGISCWCTPETTAGGSRSTNREPQGATSSGERRATARRCSPASTSRPVTSGWKG